MIIHQFSNNINQSTINWCSNIRSCTRVGSPSARFTRKRTACPVRLTLLTRSWPANCRWNFLRHLLVSISHVHHTEKYVALACLISLSKFNLPLMGTFTWPTPPGLTEPRPGGGRELNYGSQTFLTTQGHGGPPRMSDQLNAGATSETAQTWKTNKPSTHSVKPTRRIWNDDYDGQMIFGDLGGLKFRDICFTGGEKPRKNLTQETCPDRGSNPGPLRDKRACYHLLHSGGHINCYQWTCFSVYSTIIIVMNNL